MKAKLLIIATSVVLSLPNLTSKGGHEDIMANSHLKEFTCPENETTGTFDMWIEDLNGNDVTGQVLDIQTGYRVHIDMDGALFPGCAVNAAYIITNQWGMSPNSLAKDSSGGDVTYYISLGGVASKVAVLGSMSWGITIAPMGRINGTGPYVAINAHAQTLSGTAN